MIIPPSGEPFLEQADGDQLYDVEGSVWASLFTRFPSTTKHQVWDEIDYERVTDEMFLLQDSSHSQSNEYSSSYRGPLLVYRETPEGLLIDMAIESVGTVLEAL